MSFSTDVKLELSHLEVENECCRRAEIAGMLLSNGSLRLVGGGGVAISMQSERAAVARHIYLHIRSVFGYRCEIVVMRREHPKPRNVYTLTLRGEDAERMLIECGAVHAESVYALRGGLPQRLLQKQCCKQAFLRGAFLGCGSMTDPNGKYHLEFATARESFANALCEFLINEFEVSAKVVARRSLYVVYVKDSEHIVTVLGLMGANEALLRLESMRVVKAMRNKVNRVTNCDNANVDKAIDAAMRQVQAIRDIDAYMGLDNLTPALREVAKLRLANDNLPLQELGLMLEPPLGKSAVNHRLRRIEELAEKLRAQREGHGG